MLLTAIAPEVMIYQSIDRYLDARQLLHQLVTHSGEGWTMTHAQFAMAGGIRLRDVHGAMVPNRKKSLIEAVKSGKVREPPISVEELSSRSKSDWIVKSIAICQVTWFALQALFRAVKHVQVTALEILTVAFVFCSIFIYAICWNQPQDVEYPIVISQILEQSDSRSADGQEIHCDQQEIIDLESGLMLQSESRSGTPLQNIDVSEAGDVGHPDSAPNTIARLECIANAGENHECNPYQTRPQASSSKISGERNPRSSTTVVPEATVVKINANISDLIDALTDYVEEMVFLILGLLGPLFGAIHCLAWNSPFPTSQERSAWRVCSVAVTCLPLALLLVAWILLHTPVQHKSYSERNLYNLFWLSLISYPVARITLIVLAFIALRALPADAYQTVSWNSYIPHFGA